MANTQTQPLLRYNTFAELQKEICDILNTAPVLQQCNVQFIPENRLDIESMISTALQKQGIAAVVMTPDGQYIGYRGHGCVYQLNELTLMLTEYTPINRAKNKAYVATGLDIANFCAETLAGPDAIIGFGKLNLKGIEQGEDNGLLVTKVTFQTTISNEDVPPYIWIEYATKEELSAAIADLSATVDSRLSDVAASTRAKLLPDYLYELEFSDSYPEAAEEFYDDFEVGKCSAIREGSTFARNYDWLFSEAATFVIKRNKVGNVHASVGVASLGSKLTDKDVKSGKWDKWYKALPGMTLDGINDAGVFGTMNVVAAKTPVGYDGDYCGFGAVRYVLDNFDNAADAAAWVAANVYIPTKFIEQGYSLHYLFGDENETWAVEDGVARKIVADKAIMTNFRLFNGSDTIHTDRADIATYDPYGSGLERYELLSADGADAIFEARFTVAYDDGFPRPTEFVGATADLTLSSSDDDLRAWAEEHVPATRERGDGTWQSVHTSQYDIANRTLTIRVQEQDDPYVFVVPAFTKEDIVLAWGNLSGDLSNQTDLQNTIDGLSDAIDINASDIGEISVGLEAVQNELATTSALLSGAIDDLSDAIDDTNEAVEELAESKADKTDLSAYARKANTSIDYNSTTKKITLDADGHTTQIDATAFIKDGMVDNARYDAQTKMIVITFNTDAGKEPISVDVAALVHEYTAGTGLILDNAEFSVDTTVIAQKSDLEPYALSIDVDERLEDKADLTAIEELEEKDEALSAEISSVVTVTGISGDIYHNLSVVHITQAEYYELLVLSALQPNCLYVLDRENYIDAFGQQIKNLSGPTVSSDAATKKYVDDAISGHFDPSVLSAYALSADVDSRLTAKADLTAIGNGTLTIKQGTTTLGTFTANQKTGTTVTIPAQQAPSWGQITGNLTAQTDLKNALDAKADDSDLEPYALSADVDRRLTAKADLTAIGDATVTINQDGVQKAQFTLNQKNNVTVNLEKGDEAAWGNITGDLSAQTDLKQVLDVKVDRIELTAYALQDDIEDLSAEVQTNKLSIGTLDEKKADKAELSGIVFVKDADGNTYSKLSVVHISQREYYEQMILSALVPNCLYVLDTDEYVDAFGRQIKNVAEPTDLSDVTPKWYVDSAISSSRFDPAVLSDYALSANVDSRLAVKADLSTLNAKTTPTYPSTDAALSALAGARDTANFVNSSINAFAAFYITKDAAGSPFETVSELMGATVFYNGGEARVPTKNDYAIVIADEDHPIEVPEKEPVYPTTRYSFQGGTYPDGQWEYQYTVNNTPFTNEQWQAVNSEINAQLVQVIRDNETAIQGLNDEVERLDSDKADRSELEDYALSADVDERLADKADVDDIPTVNNPTITITQGNAIKGSFSLNQSNAQTIALDGGGAGSGSRVLLVSWENDVPYDAEIEYIQTDGNCYFNTGLSPSNNMTLDLSAYIMRAGLGWTFGTDSGWGSDGGFAFGYQDTNVGKLGYAQFYYGNNAQGPIENVQQSRDIHVQFVNKVCYCDGDVYYTFTNNVGSRTYEMYLFALNRSGNPIEYAASGNKIYSFQCSNGTTEVDLIPVRVGQTAYFYDRISERLIGKSGSGTPILGPDKN